MAERKFKTPSFEQFRALCTLKKAGVTELVVEFEGCDDSGFFDDLSVLPKEWGLHKKYQAELQLAEEYLYSNFELYGKHISFNDEGCRGAIKLNLQKELPEVCLMVYVPTRSWRVATNYTSEISPSTEVERLLSETD